MFDGGNQHMTVLLSTPLIMRDCMEALGRTRAFSHAAIL